MSTEPKNSPKDYAPAAIPASEDTTFQEALDHASEDQFKGMVRDLSRKRLDHCTCAGEPVARNGVCTECGAIVPNGEN